MALLCSLFLCMSLLFSQDIGCVFLFHVIPGAIFGAAAASLSQSLPECIPIGAVMSEL